MGLQGHLLVLILAPAILRSDQSDYKSYGMKCLESSANSSTIVSDYKVERIKNELIVKFRGWYSVSARKSFITAALKGQHPNKINIVERKNPMAGYPSDFDLLIIDAAESEISLKLLENHPLVKSVTWLTK